MMYKFRYCPSELQACMLHKFPYRPPGLQACMVYKCAYRPSGLQEFLNETSFLCDESLNESSALNCFDELISVNLNLKNGSPLGENNFRCLHFNINSIAAEGRLEQLSSFCKTLKVGCLALTESKLDDSIPTSTILIEGMYEPLRRDRTRQAGGCLLYFSQSFTFKQMSNLQSDKYEHISADIRLRDKLYSVNTL